MSTRPLLTKWIGEFCAPVVVTVATAEVENICLKNGLLLHELLSAFGKLDSANATIRSSNSQVEINDAHIRFERVTWSNTAEQLMVRSMAFRWVGQQSVSV